MSDLTVELLPRLREHRLPGLDLDGDFIYPNYQGGSILNIPSSICRLLGVPDFAAEPLYADILLMLGTDVRKVVFILLDALALHRLQRWMSDGTAPVWGELSQSGLLAPLTSITPSTTSAALTSLWTGRSAAVHGITGYEMWLKEYGVVANTILHTPMTFQNDIGGLSRAGFKPDEFLNLPTLGSHLADHGVETHAFQYSGIVNSGLSKMYFESVKRQAFTTAADLWVNARELLEDNPGKRQYVYVYWSVVDTLSHRYGPDDERTAAEFGSFSAAFQSLFLERLSPTARQDTLLILTADHGQLSTPLDAHYELRNHPNLVSHLHMQPTGENRLTYLHVRPGQVRAVRDYIERTWPDQFIVLESAHLIEQKLFGLGTPHRHLLDRLGDLILIPRSEAYLWWSAKENFLLGRHGGLHPHEMLVPFLAVRL